MTELEKLAARVESEGPSRELLLEAFEAVFPIPPIESGEGCDGGCPLCEYEDRRQQFLAMLDCGAYESAAMTLVPEAERESIHLTAHRAIVGHSMAYADSMAAALCAAALRANQGEPK